MDADADPASALNAVTVVTPVLNGARYVNVAMPFLVVALKVPVELKVTPELVVSILWWKDQSQLRDLDSE